MHHFGECFGSCLGIEHCRAAVNNGALYGWVLAVGVMVRYVGSGEEGGWEEFSAGRAATGGVDGEGTN